jgi:hypothetical protein
MRASWRPTNPTEEVKDGRVRSALQLTPATAGTVWVLETRLHEPFRPTSQRSCI